jgi:hypothetical protein
MLDVSDSRLKADFDAWKDLPEAVKDGVAAMVKASRQGLK